MGQKKNSVKILMTSIALCAFVAAMNWVWGCQSVDGAKPPVSVSRALSKDGLIEQPAKLTGQSERMLPKTQFVISYNDERKCPNYVCWSLTPQRLQGRVERTEKFYADTTLEESVRVDYFDYRNSGYDRGHMCPAADNKNSEEGMSESFLMTNICPQDRDLNANEWNDLEQRCRAWARKGNTLYICCGPIFDTEGVKKIGVRKNMKVAVPDRFFKVVLTLGEEPKAIGFIFPNRPCDGGLDAYAVSVDEVEEETGMDFFHILEDAEEDKLEAAFSLNEWGME